eukprot:scaffold41583_cov36-Phaeocystis_antarctica.AAC.1
MPLGLVCSSKTMASIYVCVFTTVCAAATVAATAAALFRHRSPHQHHQPARVAGSDGTLTIGSAEVVRAPKACTCLAKGSHIKGAAEDKGA